MKRWESKHIEFVKNTARLLCGEAYAKFCEALTSDTRTTKGSILFHKEQRK